MLKFGITLLYAIDCATLGWSGCVGTLKPGKFADIIAAPGKQLEEITKLERIKFVMNGGEAVAVMDYLRYA